MLKHPESPPAERIKPRDLHTERLVGDRELCRPHMPDTSIAKTRDHLSERRKECSPCGSRHHQWTMASMVLILLLALPAQSAPREGVQEVEARGGRQRGTLVGEVEMMRVDGEEMNTEDLQVDAEYAINRAKNSKRLVEAKGRKGNYAYLTNGLRHQNLDNGRGRLRTYRHITTNKQSVSIEHFDIRASKSTQRNVATLHHKDNEIFGHKVKRNAPIPTEAPARSNVPFDDKQLQTNYGNEGIDDLRYATNAGTSFQISDIILPIINAIFPKESQRDAWDVTVDDGLGPAARWGGNDRQGRQVMDATGQKESNYVDPQETDEVEYLVRKWAPVVWLAPDEKYFPLSAEKFLENVTPLEPNQLQLGTMDTIPEGPDSEMWYLVTKQPIVKLLQNSSSFLHGENPNHANVPTYAYITRCQPENPHKNNINQHPQSNVFHVTYWFYFPYNEGKDVCILNLGVFGPLPFPQINNKCLGRTRKYGNHVGDWEHVSLFFKGKEPDGMYVSTHDFGVYYKYNATAKLFVYDRQETRRGIPQNPKFSKFVKMKNGRPVLFSARGSHGIWSSPGLHRFTRVPKLYDSCGYGTSWKTWENLVILDAAADYKHPLLRFWGRWGNPKGFCHPIKRVGINFCQLVDGPTGIPQKRLNYDCPA